MIPSSKQGSPITTPQSGCLTYRQTAGCEASTSAFTRYQHTRNETGGEGGGGNTYTRMAAIGAHPLPFRFVFWLSFCFLFCDPMLVFMHRRHARCAMRDARCATCACVTVAVRRHLALPGSSPAGHRRAGGSADTQVSRSVGRCGGVGGAGSAVWVRCCAFSCDYSMAAC